MWQIKKKSLIEIYFPLIIIIEAVYKASVPVVMSSEHPSTTIYYIYLSSALLLFQFIFLEKRENNTECFGNRKTVLINLIKTALKSHYHRRQ
mmetsp:Transcript_11846/g.17738  ORF Transcript_11846/g.17738 Transcript_11846/m.17738 type:complete len:92 (+) Transcript_11846:122-397(+)